MSESSMSTVANDQLIPIGKVNELLPIGPVPEQTIRLWASRGCYGRRLWSTRVGGRIFTTAAAVKEFLENGAGNMAIEQLLEALRNVVHVHHNGTVIDMETAIEQCEAAIAKATGASP